MIRTEEGDPHSPHQVSPSATSKSCLPAVITLLTAHSSDLQSSYIYFRSIAEKGPSADEKISSLEAVVSNYEAKVGGLEHEIEAQKEEYEKKLLDFAARLDFSL